MKKTLFTVIGVAALILSCSKSETLTVSEVETLYAHIEENEGTKTILDKDGNVLWSEDDRIVAFLKSSLGQQYKIAQEGVGKTFGRFQRITSTGNDDLNAGMEWSHNVAYYPYMTDADCKKMDDTYTLTVTLPSEQTYVAGSFANEAFPMVAVSDDNNLAFRNICGGIKFQLKGTQKVTSVQLEGKNSEKLSGSATVTAYPGDLAPAITMSSDASTSVTLDCGDGVQLNESTATEFIISLPPVLFSKGFTVAVTDTDGKTYTVETDKANTVLRSSLLTMPVVVMTESSGEPEVETTIIPVGGVTLNKTSLTLPDDFSYMLTAKIAPIDATDHSVTWSSSDASIVSIDQSGAIVTLSSGMAKITAEAGGVTATCTIMVVASAAIAMTDYIDEYGVNHGKGVVIGNTVWAPVNCGYKVATLDSKGYTCGKLYQWGRKYGQGYSTLYDEFAPEILEGPISVVNGQRELYSNTYFSSVGYPKDWISPKDDDLWNSGTNDSPVKTDYDPCPKGWRVPTYDELDKLSTNKSPWASKDNHSGYWFCGLYTYLSTIPMVFFPAAGYRTSKGGASSREDYGEYWSSSVANVQSESLGFHDEGISSTSNTYRSYGCSVRCVQE